MSFRSLYLNIRRSLSPKHKICTGAGINIIQIFTSRTTHGRCGASSLQPFREKSSPCPHSGSAAFFTEGLPLLAVNERQIRKGELIFTLVLTWHDAKLSHNEHYTKLPEHIRNSRQIIRPDYNSCLVSCLSEANFARMCVMRSLA